MQVLIRYTLRCAAPTLFGKITLIARILYKTYWLIIKYKFSKMENIDKLKELIKATSGLVVELAQDIKDDQKLDITEILGLVPEMLKFVKQIPNFKEVLEEIKDLDSAEAQELVAFIESDSGIPSGDAKVVLENCIEIYSKVMDIYNVNIVAIVDALKK